MNSFVTMYKVTDNCYCGYDLPFESVVVTSWHVAMYGKQFVSSGQYFLLL